MKNTCMNRLFVSFVIIIMVFRVSLIFAKENSTSQDAPSPYAALTSTFEDSIQNEKNQIQELKYQVIQLPQREENIRTELNVYSVQHATYSNLLLFSGTSLKYLEKAWMDHQSSIISIEARIKELKQKMTDLANTLKNAEQQSAINTKQLSELTTDTHMSPEKDLLVSQIKSLSGMLYEKKKLIEQLLAFYSIHEEKFNEIQSGLKALSQQFKSQIKEMKSELLLVRKQKPFTYQHWSHLDDELLMLMTEGSRLISREYWEREFQMIKKSGFQSLAACLLFYVLILLVVNRIRLFFGRLEQKPFFSRCPALQVALFVMNRSMFLLGTTFFLFIYFRIGLLHSASPLLRVVYNIVWILLFTRWGLDIINYCAKDECTLFDARFRVIFYLLFVFIRIVAILYASISFLLSMDSVLLLFYRLCIELCLLAWCIRYSNSIKRSGDLSADNRKRTLFMAVAAYCYLISIGGFLFDLAGYGALAMYWLISWGKSIVVGLWAIVAWFVLIELDKTEINKSDRAIKDHQEKITYPIKWVVLRFGILLWGIILFSALILSWGGGQIVFSKLWVVLNYPFKVGSMSLSISGFIYFIIILLITHGLAKFWQYLFQNKILSRSGMEKGLQSSLTTITVYLIWSIGILIALHSVGFNTTTITVAFGALGIGLGFGLQNIFNNFISGIILLFERPIQVGDDIEINGIWATVRRIHVRSTIVQTYDNASLIIPNSELISNQVTNWSFKDRRIRRNIVVGVAYGSDVELVKTTLLEVASNEPDVLKYPQPDVLFSDFGDSALIMKLRVWMMVSNFYTTETNIRFEIDRLFRERKITIAFPQRDVHIYKSSSVINVPGD